MSQRLCNVNRPQKGIVRLLSVVNGREKAQIKAFLKSMPRRLRNTVNADKEAFRNKVIIVIDRLHIAKLYRQCLDKYKQKTLAELKQRLTAKEYEKLKGAMHILRKGNECSCKKEKVVVDELFPHSSGLAKAYRLRLKLTQIFNTHMGKLASIKKLNEWIREVRHAKSACFDSFIKTLCKYKNEISNYFIDHNTSDFVEGINNKAKVLKRQC